MEGKHKGHLYDLGPQFHPHSKNETKQNKKQAVGGVGGCRGSRMMDLNSILVLGEIVEVLKQTWEGGGAGPTPNFPVKPKGTILTVEGSQILNPPNS